VLDSDQNVKFRDHYVEIPLDLSNVLFIATANDRTQIPRPLLDRMEIIEISTYIENEKFHIAKEFLYEKQLRKNGLKKSQLKITDAAIYTIIQYYTREAGVRELERKLGEICRKSAKMILEKKTKKVAINERNIFEFLGKHKYSIKKANIKDQIGIVRGLAWTVVGGDTLQIEVNVMEGKGEIELTGQLGDVMKESARTGISYIRSLEGSYKINPVYFKEHDIHIHIPEGAVPKDGPSAGITMALAVYSAITNRKVKHDVAMTGEITLRGKVLPVGGIKEKILAAKRAKMEHIILSKENEQDIKEIKEMYIKGLKFHYVDSMMEAVNFALLDEKVDNPVKFEVEKG
jgi:ATP-dependent Lon protease